MLRSVCWLLILANLTACDPGIFVKKEYVDVPYPTSCVTWEPTRSASRFDAMEPASPVWEQVKALLLDRENDQHFIEGQTAVIEGCK